MSRNLQSPDHPWLQGNLGKQRRPELSGLAYTYMIHRLGHNAAPDKIRAQLMKKEKEGWWEDGRVCQPQSWWQGWKRIGLPDSSLSQYARDREFPGIGPPPVAAKGESSIPSWGTKFPQVMQYSKKKKKIAWDIFVWKYYFLYVWKSDLTECLLFSFANTLAPTLWEISLQ